MDEFECEAIVTGVNNIYKFALFLVNCNKINFTSVLYRQIKFKKHIDLVAILLLHCLFLEISVNVSIMFM